MILPNITWLSVQGSCSLMLFDEIEKLHTKAAQMFLVIKSTR